MGLKNVLETDLYLQNTGCSENNNPRDAVVDSKFE